jgi:predicted Zn-dependent protease
VAYRLDSKLYRITGLAPRGSGLLPAMTDAARTFRRLSGAEAGRQREKRIAIVTVLSGDTTERLARRMNFDAWRVERFRVLNGLRPGQPLRAGERVKLVR